MACSISCAVPTWNLQGKTPTEIAEKLQPQESFQGGLKAWPELKNLGQKKPVQNPPPAEAHKNILKPEASAAAVSRPIPGVHFQKAEKKYGQANKSFDQPEDVSGITLAEIQKGSASEFVGGLKDLVAKFGYHTVIFNLEKSELYKTYIATGTQILTKETNFEDLAQDSRYMQRKDFENFTDLLMQIQAE